MQEYVGRSETRHDRLDALRLRGLAATLGAAVPEVLPPLWHWVLFQDWVLPDAIGPDGHPRRGGFLPPVHDLPRRMWAGGRVRFLGELRADEAVERTSTILSVTEKHGQTGRLVFTTVRHVITGPRGPVIEEEQDLVYAPIALPAPPQPATHAPEGPRRTVLPDPVMLFRYSALTGNGHRIHYDMDYARDVEGYAGLVVHGPLQATWLAGLVAAPLTRFAFRGRRPAFHGTPLRLEAWADGAITRLCTRNPAGEICMEAHGE